MVCSIKFAALAVLPCLIFLLIGTHLAYLAISAHPTSDHASNRDVVSPHAIIGDKEEAIIEALWPEDGQDAIFFLSLNSCVDGCEPSSQDKSSSHNTEKILKVGLLAPPGRMSGAFFSFCKELGQKISTAGKGQEGDIVQWIPTHHLPFSNNEYTHIIRFANVPMLLAAGDALQTVLTMSQLAVSDGPQIAWQDIIETTKLLVSWHCQISNMVDDGTVPLVTISMEELEQDSYEQENMLLGFLKSSAAEETVMGSAEGSGEGDGIAEPTFDETFLKETIGNIKPMLKQANRALLKTMDKGLVTLTKQTIKQSLNGVEGCPNEENLYNPTRPLPQLLYSFLKTGNTKDDLELCIGDNTATAVCKMLEEARAQVSYL